MTTTMISKYFLLAFICISLTQVQGDELENAVKKGLLKVEEFYKRGIRRIDAVNGHENQIIQTQSAAFMKKIQRMQESFKKILRSTAQRAEEKAKEMQKPDSALECITKAEKNANDQIQAQTTKFLADMERFKEMYSAKLQAAIGPLTTYKNEFEAKYKKTVSQIKDCKTTSCVEIAVNNFYMDFERLLEAVNKVQNQVTTIVSNFQKEARTAFNNANKQISTIKSTGLRQIKKCVFESDVFEEQQ